MKVRNLRDILNLIETEEMLEAEIWVQDQTDRQMKVESHDLELGDAAETSAFMLYAEEQ